jgi:hypothetical protein
MKTTLNTPLVLAFIIVTVVFLLFCGGLIALTLMNSEMNKAGVMYNINWMWIPTMVTFLISVLLGWALFSRRND